MRPTRSERVYRALLRAYPAGFRQRFGDEMAQLFGDQLRDARSRGSRGTTATWFRALGDLATTAVSERLQGGVTVAHSLERRPSRADRLLGVLGIAGGFILVAALIPGIPWSWAVFNLRLVLFEAGAIAVVVAVIRLLPPSWRGPSLLVGVPTILANAAHLVMSIMFVGRPQPPEPDPEFRPLYALAATAMWLTDAVFGLMALRLGVVSRWAPGVLTLGSVLAVTGVSGLGFTRGPNADLVDTLTVAGVVLVGIGWILFGVEIGFRGRRRPAGVVDETPGEAG